MHIIRHFKHIMLRPLFGFGGVRVVIENHVFFFAVFVFLNVGVEPLGQNG